MEVEPEEHYQTSQLKVEVEVPHEQNQLRTFEKNYQMRYQSSSLKVEVDHQMIVRQIGLDYQMSQMEQHLVEVELH